MNIQEIKIGKSWKVESTSEKGKFYGIEYDENGELVCSCPAKNKCKHIKEIEGLLGEIKSEVFEKPTYGKDALIKQAESFFSIGGNTKGYVKICIDGEGGAGKTYTAVDFAINLHVRIGSTKPIVYFDTETGHKFLYKLFQEKGIQLSYIESKSLVDFKKAMEFCRNGYADIFIGDSITHVWKAYVKAYLKKKNRNYMQIQDWDILRDYWRDEVSHHFVHDHYHAIICGRAGTRWKNVYDEESNRNELFSEGTKMLADGQMEFEGDLTIHMERHEELSKNKKGKKVWRLATLKKSRYIPLDGKVFENPKYEDIAPAVEYLLSEPKDTFIANDNSEELFEREEKSKQYMEAKDGVLAEIKALFDLISGGNSVQAKNKKAEISHEIFGVRTGVQVAKLSLDALTVGKDKLEEKLNELKAANE